MACLSACGGSDVNVAGSASSPAATVTPTSTTGTTTTATSGATTTSSAGAGTTATVTPTNITASAPVSITAPAAVVTPAAAAVGYQTQTFGPQLTLGVNWWPNNFYSASIPATQNPDGTVLITAQGIASATYDTSKPHQWRGLAFGGGAYFEAVLHFSNADNSALTPSWPAFWSTDIENMSQNAVTASTQWAGQPQGFGNWIETDFFEYDRGNVNEYGIQIHNWYGYHAHARVQDVLSYSTAPIKVAEGFNWADAHKYGYLWVPATATTQGYAEGFMDDVQMGPTIYWNQYDPEAPPPPLPGTTAVSVWDSRHVILMLDTGPHNPMTIETVTVWQASDSNNLTQ